MSPDVFTSPLAIKMLMHYYAIPKHFQDVQPHELPPSQYAIYTKFLRDGIIEVNSKGMANCTPLGELLVQKIKGDFANAYSQALCM